MKKVIILGGPTASGKSKLAIKLAKELNGEIINADSMQVYKHFPILTSQPKEKDLKKIKHHLYGYINTNKEFNAIMWLSDVIKKIDTLQFKNKVPIVVGGSGLYLEFLCKGINNLPIISDKTKKKVEQVIQNTRKKKIQELLYEIDAEYLSKINISDTLRVSKLLQVYFQTKKNITFFHQSKRQVNEYNFLKIFYKPDREVVKLNIKKRFYQMLEDGLIQEVNSNNKKVKNSNISKAIGYGEIIDYLNKKISFEEVSSVMLRKTKNFAKRQYTWFNNRYVSDITLQSKDNYSLIVESFIKIN